ncbi:MAG TPA: zinc-ribbon domain-containing protein [Chitinolyticbacter sp.]|nr:zinc-ribbon domain-containing protein [Chitinolyticbacter sp.]
MSESQTTIPCPDCGQPLEVLQACGAKSYICPHCNELKSKSRIEAPPAPASD